MPTILDTMKKDMLERMNRHERRKRGMTEEKLKEIQDIHNAWIERQIKELVPGWVYRLVVKHDWRWLAKLSGIHLRFYQDGISLNWVTEIRKWGKVRAVRQIDIDVVYESNVKK